MNAYGAGERDRWMLDEGSLDLVWADVGAVVDDHLLHAAEEPEVAVIVGPGEVRAFLRDLVSASEPPAAATD